MQRFVRTLMIWMVALALPLQGYAAAAMVTCGPMHSRMASASEDHHDHDSSAHGHHSTDAGVNPAGEEPSSLARFLKFKCSACASCCTAAAAPSPVLPLPVVMQLHAEAIPFSGSFEHSVVSDALERPPRTPLA
jgi:hypothetical protein